MYSRDSGRRRTERQTGSCFRRDKASGIQSNRRRRKDHYLCKGVSAHASTPAFGVNAAGVIFDCLAKAGFEDDFVDFYNSHIGTACDGSGIGLKCADEFGELTFCNGIVKTEDGVISATIDIRFPVTYSVEDMVKMCEGKLEDENGRIEIHTTTKPLFFPKESPLVEALYKAYTDVTGDTENKPLVIGGGTYAKSLKNIIAFGPEKPGVDYRIHGADSTHSCQRLKKQFMFIWKQSRTCLQSNQNSSCRKNDHL